MNLRPLAGGSREFDDITAFRQEAKRRGFRVEGNFRTRGSIVHAFDSKDQKVGFMVNYNGGAGFLSPHHQAFRIDYIDDVVRQQEETKNPVDKILLGESIEERKKSL